MLPGRPQWAARAGGILAADITSAGDAMLVERMQRAARLDVTLYNEVEHDDDATQEAIYVVAIYAVASGIGTLIGSPGQTQGLIGFASEILTTLLNWVIWSYVTYFIGTRFFNGTATPGEMMRTLGYAMSPGVFNVLGFIPCVGSLIRLAVFVWILVAGVVAVREALDLQTPQALWTVGIGWLAMLAIFFAQLLVFSALGWSFRML
jgi:hypothetical protein